MSIQNIRILPPFAIGRFGSSPSPLEAFDLEVKEDAPLDFQQIVPKPTLKVDPQTGAIVERYTPDYVSFRDGERIRPVCPFLEVFVQTDSDQWQPLTLELLAAEGLEADALRWTVEVGNLKAFRQTRDPDDRIFASVKGFNDHAPHELHGSCSHFRLKRSIPFGTVQYIRPTAEFPQIRFRFTPAAGLVYGSSKMRWNPDTKKDDIEDPVFKDDPDESRIVYDPDKGKWRGFSSPDRSVVTTPDKIFESVTLTNPSDIYEGFGDSFSIGYLDDVCDGPVSVELKLNGGKCLKARAWISAAMPAFAPDSRPLRTVADDLEQWILGHEIDDAEVSIDQAAEIVRRALETIRLMNTMVMNGNVINGRPNIAHTLGTQDTNDLNRLYAPIMASSLVDNLAVRALHERIYAAVKSGTAPWFASVLRLPEEVADLSDKGRRKMPPMLRGADSRSLALTRRQISRVVKAALLSSFTTSPNSVMHPSSQSGGK